MTKEHTKLRYQSDRVDALVRRTSLRGREPRGRRQARLVPHCGRENRDNRKRVDGAVQRLPSERMESYVDVTVDLCERSKLSIRLSTYRTRATSP